MTQYDIRRIGFPNIGEEVKVITKSDIVVDARKIFVWLEDESGGAE